MTIIFAPYEPSDNTPVFSEAIFLMRYEFDTCVRIVRQYRFLLARTKAKEFSSAYLSDGEQ